MKFDINNQTPILTHYGITEQTIIWCEELSELTKAASKCHRDPSTGSCLDMAEEIADVLICIKQMMQAYELTTNHIQEIIDEKCERQRKRMEEKSYERLRNTGRTHLQTSAGTSDRDDRKGAACNSGGIKEDEQPPA